MRTHTVLLAAAAGLAASLATSAHARTPIAACGERDKMVVHLEKKYGEVLRGAGLRSHDGVLELYVSKEGSWTLLLTRPDGRSCPIAVGEHWYMNEAADGSAPV